MAIIPLAILALMVVASASAGPIEVIEISPDAVGLHFDHIEDIDVQRHLAKRSPLPPFDPFSKKGSLSPFAKKGIPTFFGIKTAAKSSLPFVIPLAGAAGAGGLAGGAAVPFVLEALPLGISAAPAFG